VGIVYLFLMTRPDHAIALASVGNPAPSKGFHLQPRTALVAATQLRTALATQTIQRKELT
jgi:hypothetical protein